MRKLSLDCLKTTDLSIEENREAKQNKNQKIIKASNTKERKKKERTKYLKMLRISAT